MQNIKYLFCAAIVFLLFSCSSKDKVNVNSMGLKGSVKTIKENSYDGEGEKTITTKDFLVYNFNEKGFLKEAVYYSDDGAIYYKKICLFDKNENPIGEEEYNRKDLMFKTAYEYDIDNNLIKEEKHYLPNGQLSFIISRSPIINNKNDETIRLLVAASGCRAPGKTSFEYDKFGRTIKQISYDTLGNIQFQHTSKRDQNGNVVVSYYPNSARYSKYEYDKTGNWIKKTESDNMDFSSPFRTTIREIEYY